MSSVRGVRGVKAGQLMGSLPPPRAALTCWACSWHCCVLQDSWRAPGPMVARPRVLLG